MTTKEKQKPVVVRPGGGMDAVYGIGMIGAWVYFFKQAADNQERVTAISKDSSGPPFWFTDCSNRLKNSPNQARYR
ncbi:MAG: hypothetical protein R2844_16005 [Caldilineales bacterium]